MISAPHLALQTPFTFQEYLQATFTEFMFIYTLPTPALTCCQIVNCQPTFSSQSGLNLEGAYLVKLVVTGRMGQVQGKYAACEEDLGGLDCQLSCGISEEV
jgi:hypothetical protein